jgi:hypothetical protein
MPKPTPIISVNPETVARRNFSAHVQSVAFNLVLSKHMIDLLGAVRDWGFPYGKLEPAEFDATTRVANGAQQYIMMLKALERRGLVIYQEPDTEKYGNQRLIIPNGKPSVILSRAGELTCELLIEAGLLAKRQTPQQLKKRA